MKVSKLTRNIRLGVKNLMLHKTRSFLTTLGMVFGVGSVIAMLAVGEGAGKQAMDQIRRLGSNNIIIFSVKPASVLNSRTDQSMMNIYGLFYDDELRIRESLAYVKRTVAVRAIRKTARLGERLMELRIVGTTADWFDLVRRPLIAGRVLADHDLDKHSAVCVLTEHGARRVLATQHAIGEKIRLGGELFEVIGITMSDPGSTAIQAPDQEIDAYIPINVCRERFGEAIYRSTAGTREIELVQLHELLVEVDEMENVEPVADAINAILTRFHKDEDYRVSVPLTLLREAEKTKRTFNIVLGSIAGISLLVGGIGIMNIMLASVTERTREIGVRRAIGAKRSQIILQFLVETVVLSAVGGLVGIGVGVVIPLLITSVSGMPTFVPLYSIGLALIISMSIGIIFGLYPARRAAQLDPIEALRHE